MRNLEKAGLLLRNCGVQVCACVCVCVVQRGYQVQTQSVTFLELDFFFCLSGVDNAPHARSKMPMRSFKNRAPFTFTWISPLSQYLPLALHYNQSAAEGRGDRVLVIYYYYYHTHTHTHTHTATDRESYSFTFPELGSCPPASPALHLNCWWMLSAQMTKAWLPASFGMGAVNTSAPALPCPALPSSDGGVWILFTLQSLFDSARPPAPSEPCLYNFIFCVYWWVVFPPCDHRWWRGDRRGHCGEQAETGAAGERQKTSDHHGPGRPLPQTLPHVRPPAAAQLRRPLPGQRAWGGRRRWRGGGGGGGGGGVWRRASKQAHMHGSRLPAGLPLLRESPKLRRGGHWPQAEPQLPREEEEEWSAVPFPRPAGRDPRLGVGQDPEGGHPDPCNRVPHGAAH